MRCSHLYHGGTSEELCITQIIIVQGPVLSGAKDCLWCRHLKETGTNEIYLTKWLSVRNGIFKGGKNGQEPPCCHLAVICGIDLAFGWILN